MNRLPAELIDHIIDFHHSDDQTLSVCSLVCRNWLPASRFHLFRTVYVGHYNVHYFVKLLASPSSTIAAHLHTLSIIPYIPVVDVIAPHFKDFVMLKSMSLEGISWPPVSETTLSREFGRIGNMELTGVSYSYALHWFRLTFTPGENCSSSFSSTLRVLNSVIPDIKSSSWLPIIAQLPSVSHFRLWSINESLFEDVQVILESCGQSTHALDLSFELSTIALTSDFINLTHNTNLRSLSISDSDVIPHKPNGPVSLSKIIQRISSPFFTHFNISLRVNGCVDLTWLDCGKMAEVLNHARFSELQNVQIRIICVFDKEDEVKAWVRSEMSCLDNRGILTVTFH